MFYSKNQLFFEKKHYSVSLVVIFIVVLSCVVSMTACSDEDSSGATVMPPADKGEAGNEDVDDHQDGDGIGEDGNQNQDQKDDEKDDEKHVKVLDLRPAGLASSDGCLLDGDCVSGSFCFHGQCVTQCEKDEECGKGYTCSVRNGRCVKESFEPSGTVKRLALTDPNVADLEEANESDVVYELPDIEILTPPPTQAFIKPGQTSVTVSLTATKDYGDIDYFVRSIERGKKGSLRRAKKKISEQTGFVNYTFVLYPKASSLGDQGSSELLQIDSSIGTFDVTLVPRVPVAGVYEGGAITERMGGTALPMRFAIETVPENPTRFEDIKGITIYLPSSQADIFSPESVADGASTVWHSVKMVKEGKVKNCHGQTQCWSASYASNGFEMAGSTLIQKDRKVSRAIRIEINDFDSVDMRFSGFIKDDISGIYRNFDTDTGQKEWATATMTGNFNLVRSEGFVKTEGTVHDHVMVTEKVHRDINDMTHIKCSDEDILSLIELTSNKEKCGEIRTKQDFLTNENANECTKEFGASILSDEKLTSKIISQLISRKEDDTNPVAGFATLTDFLDNCMLKDGDPQKTVCIHRSDVDCAADLTAYAYLNSDNIAVREALMSQFHGLIRESYLGKQYAAYLQDIKTRQKWLDTADAPKFAAKDIESAVKDVLDDWEANVLRSSFDIMSRQFSQLALEVLSNQTSKSEGISAERYTLLSDFQQSWEGASKAISVCVRRYHELLQKETERVAKSKQMAPMIFDLYIAGGIESEINKNTGNSSLNGGYGNSLYNNLSALQKLSKSFNALVYMRDAEIAVSSSLNKDADTVITRRAEKAEKTLNSVTEKRDKVFKEYSDRKISQQSISASLSSSIEDLITEIVNICGVPKNCNSTDISKIMSKQECEPLAMPYYCGFELNSDSLPGRPDRTLDSRNVRVSAKIKDGKVFYTDQSGKEISLKEDDSIKDGFDPASDVNTGEAAEAILKYREAIAHYDVTQADYQALQNKVAISHESCETYAKNLQNWHKKRSDMAQKVVSGLQGIKSLQQTKYADLVKKAEETANKLNTAYEKANEELGEWKLVQLNNYNSKTQYIKDLNDLENSIYKAEASEQITNTALTEAAEIGYVIGSLAGEPNGAVGFGISIAAHSAAIVAEFITKGIEISLTNSRDKKQLESDLADAKIEYLEKIEDEEAKVEKLKVEAEFGEILKKLETEIASSDEKIDAFKVEIDRVHEEFNAEDTYNRDLQTLENMRNEHLMLVQDLLGKRALVNQARIEMLSALKHYLTLCQRAAMLKSQYDFSVERLERINNLYSTPAVIFTYASNLEAIENRVELAKERIYDYLAALEYNAVRPFIDIRRAVYLARSTNDLQAILDQLDDVVDNCGGKVNTVDDEHAIIVSVREMMGITADFQSMSAQQRFHYAMSVGNVPVKSLTRYTVDTTGKELLKSGHDLRTATFAINIKDFANLEATCNAKIAGFAFKLVGENLIKEKAGSQVHPTITMFYNGKSTLASCQPDIKAIVADIGDETAFGTYSVFNLEQSKISPNVGMNTWGNNDTSLEEYPLASSYTLLIDPEIGENQKVNWDNVEDIQMKVLYTYENVRTSNKCRY